MDSRYLSARVRRNEDARLLTGRARFVDDVRVPGMLHVAFVRSDYAHARLVGVDVAAARQRPGVVAAYTAADLGEDLHAGASAGSAATHRWTRVSCLHASPARAREDGSRLHLRQRQHGHRGRPRPVSQRRRGRHRHHRSRGPARQMSGDTLDQTSARTMQVVGDVVVAALAPIEARLRAGN